MKDKNLTIRVSPELHEQVTTLAKDSGISNTQFMRQAIKNYCDQMRSGDDHSHSESGHQKNQDQIMWLQNQLDLAANDRKASAGIILELQAEKKALYDQIERQQTLLIEENKKPRTLLMRLRSVFTG